MNEENIHVMKLPNGINLYTNSMTNAAQKWAVEHWGIKNARVFLTDEDGNQSYLLVIGETPEYESKSYEQFSCHIDGYAIANGHHQLTGWAMVLGKG